LVADDDLESRSRQILDQLLALPAPAAAATKHLLASSRDGSLADQLDREVRESAACAATDEFMDAITAVAVRTQRRST